MSTISNENISEINTLLDSGAYQSIVNNKIVENLKSNNVEPTTSTTDLVGRNVSILKQTTLVFSLPMHEKRTIETLVHVSPNLEKYNMSL